MPMPAFDVPYAAPTAEIEHTQTIGQYGAIALIHLRTAEYHLG
jgi:hypothetical protein